MCSVCILFHMRFTANYVFYYFMTCAFSRRWRAIDLFVYHRAACVNRLNLGRTTKSTATTSFAIDQIANTQTHRYTPSFPILGNLVFTNRIKFNECQLETDTFRRRERGAMKTTTLCHLFEIYIFELQRCERVEGQSKCSG